ncbi:hypothetical protein PT974_02695 [Cladobotryum mycophilum]|uniref:HNH nuclease domain-containing protein n=1 Tax=Cladobotryum mycophilum TaxID=491253 RepID=A0ABR0T014_9HYPO
MAYIVPDLGEINTDYLFGEAPSSYGHFMSPQNGIPMKSSYQEIWNNGHIVLAPVKGTTDVKVVVLDSTNDDPLVNEIDGRTLSFRNEFRPAENYLCFRLITTLLRQHRHKEADWWRAYIHQGLEVMWELPETELCKASIRTLALRIGLLNSKDALYLATGSNQSLEREERDNEISDLVTLATNSARVDVLTEAVQTFLKSRI